MGLFNKKELARIAELEEKLSVEKGKNEALGIYKYEDSVWKIESAQKEAQEEIETLRAEIARLNIKRISANSKLAELNSELEKLNEGVRKAQTAQSNQENKVKRLKELCKALKDGYDFENKTIDSLIDEAELLSPTVMANLQCYTYQDLRKEYKENEKNVKEVLAKYQSRYTTKANKAIYQLMVIALQSELQNILINMKYDKLEAATAQVENLCAKFLNIATDGSQSIAPTLKRFIGEIKYLFINAVKIEYEYYVKKERVREEQIAIREQMRIENEERAELEKQRQQVEKEESKYFTEIENVKEQIANTTDTEKLISLENKIKELQEKLDRVEEQKEEILKRQNGKAGNVYVISNLGSFGDNVFKIGMTRRLEPLDRVRELGDASVPFGFDVHAMIFSEDAVSLESKLHSSLEQRRLNKVNLRKEFFKLSIDEIEKSVLTEDPAASFNRTMFAEQYRQSLSIAAI